MFRIRIRNSDPDLGGQKLPTKIEKVQKFHVLKCGCSLFRSKAIFDKKISNFFLLVVIKPWIRIRIGIQPKMPDPDPESKNPDPKQCSVGTQ